MDLEYLSGLDKKKENRYQMVIISAKYARSLNRKKMRAKEDILSLEHKEPINKVTEQALKDLMSDKIEFDKTNSE